MLVVDLETAVSSCSADRWALVSASCERVAEWSPVIVMAFFE